MSSPAFGRNGGVDGVRAGRATTAGKREDIQKERKSRRSASRAGDGARLQPDGTSTVDSNALIEVDDGIVPPPSRTTIDHPGPSDQIFTHRFVNVATDRHVGLMCIDELPDRCAPRVLSRIEQIDFRICRRRMRDEYLPTSCPDIPPSCLRPSSNLRFGNLVRRMQRREGCG